MGVGRVECFSFVIYGVELGSLLLGRSFVFSVSGVYWVRVLSGV